MNTFNKTFEKTIEILGFSLLALALALILGMFVACMITMIASGEVISLLVIASLVCGYFYSELSGR